MSEPVDRVFGLADPVAHPQRVELFSAFQKYAVSNLGLQERVRAKLSLTRSEMEALRFVYRREILGLPVRPVDVARALGLSASATTTILDRLEAGGYTVRIVDPQSRRSRRVTLTDQSRPQLSALLESSGVALNTFFESLNVVDARRLSRQLESISDALDQGAR